MNTEDRQIIEITVNGRIAKSPAEKIVCDNSEYWVHFNFSEDWNDKPAKTARFVYSGEIIDRPFTGEMVQIPPVIDANMILVGVFSGNIRTTTPAVVECLPSIRGAIGAPANPPTSTYDQLIELINNLQIEKGYPSDDIPLAFGEATPGKSMKYARGDHIHPAPELNDFVKNTDYASTENYGLVRINWANGIGVANGSLAVACAWEEHIKDKSNYSRPICPNMLDYAVKHSLTTNTRSLTDEEKAKALAWLGVGEAGDGVLGLAQYAKYEGSTNKMTPGIVSYNAIFGITAFNNASWPNTLAISGATDAIIDQQEDIYRPITVAKLSHAVKVGVTANKETLTDEEKAAAQAWLDYVRTTDIAEIGKHGLVKANWSYGIGLVDNGTMAIVTSSESDIDQRNTIELLKYKALTLNRIDYAVKKSITTNTYTLTDEEKLAAQTWLGLNEKASVAEVNAAISIANEAKATADNISGIANNALGVANNALTIATTTKTECEEYHDEVKALLSVDDETLNELREIVAYVKSNKALIDEITVKKVNVADIVDNLSTERADLPLSANQGVALKALILDVNDSLTEGQRDLSSDLNAEVARAKAAEKTNADAIAEIVDWANNTDQDITDVTSQALRGYTVSSADATLEKTADSPKVRVEGTPEEYLMFEDAYRVSDYAVAKENLLGAAISARYIFDNMGGSVNADNYSESFEHTITLDDMLTIAEFNSGYRIIINKALSNGSHTFSGYIYVVNDYEAYTSDSGITFDSNGIYLSLNNSESASGYYIQEISKLTFTNTERVKSSGEYIDLTSNIDFSMLLKRIEALEGKA